MGKLPAFQFYPGDWMKDPALRRCSHAAKGVWIDILCLMFECDERGVLVTGSRPWPLEDVIAAVGCNADVTRKCIDELVTKGVCKVRDDGAYYSERMVSDEHKRSICNERVKKHRAAAVKRTCNADVTQTKHDSSSSISSSTSIKKTSLSLTPELPKSTHLNNPRFAALWDRWGRHLLEEGKPLTPTRSESQLYELASFTLEEAVAIVEFSINRGAKNLITNGDHKLERSSERRSSAARRKTPGLEGIIQ